jgi:hypothetical protein
MVHFIAYGSSVAVLSAERKYLEFKMVLMQRSDTELPTVLFLYFISERDFIPC